MESVSVACSAFSDPFTLLTGGSDNFVLLWRVIHSSSSSSSSSASTNGTRLKLSHLMRGHSDQVVCITASRAWSLIVSGSRDGSAIVWDLNRASYVRSLWHERGVTGVAVHETSVCACLYVFFVIRSAGYLLLQGLPKRMSFISAIRVPCPFYRSSIAIVVRSGLTN